MASLYPLIIMPLIILLLKNLLYLPDGCTTEVFSENIHNLFQI